MTSGRNGFCNLFLQFTLVSKRPTSGFSQARDLVLHPGVTEEKRVGLVLVDFTPGVIGAVVELIT
jgi:hypothetical protein